jgi:multiple sugar transport system substrate-binding protein
MRRIAWWVALSLVVALGGCTEQADRSHGPITLVHPEDTTNDRQVERLVGQWNARNPKERVTFRQLPAETDRQRQWLLEAATNPHYDVLALDVIWMAEFARAGLLRELTAADLPPAGEFRPSSWQTTVIDGRNWAVPLNANAALLYYRTDLLTAANVQGPPGDDLAAIAKRVRAINPGIGGYAGQYDKYEGLVVNVFEAVWAAGGEVISDNGTEVRIGTPAGRAGLRALIQQVRGGLVPAQARNFREEQGVEAFGARQLLFLRSWPYAYARLRGSAVSGSFDVRPLGHPSVLGGTNLAISRQSRHPATASAFIRFMTSESSQRQLRDLGSLPPTRTALYPTGGTGDQPYLADLSVALDQARPRPVTERYAAISQAIADVVYPALFPPDSAPAAAPADVDVVAARIADELNVRLAAILSG